MTQQGHARLDYSAPPVLTHKEADTLAARLLGDTPTTLGGLHIAHARRVAAAMLRRGDDRTFAAALLHDVVETERVTLEELHNTTRDARLVELVDILTRRTGENDRQYLTRCASDPAALVIKRADLADKILCDDFTVAPAAAELLQRQAIERLALLDTIARDQAPPDGRIALRRTAGCWAVSLPQLG